MLLFFLAEVESRNRFFKNLREDIQSTHCNSRLESRQTLLISQSKLF